MYIKVVGVKYKKKYYEYVRVVESRTEWGSDRKEVVVATLGTVEHVRRQVPQLIDGLKRLS